MLPNWSSFDRRPQPSGQLVQTGTNTGRKLTMPLLTALLTLLIALPR